MIIAVIFFISFTREELTSKEKLNTRNKTDSTNTEITSYGTWKYKYIKKYGRSPKTGNASLGGFAVIEVNRNSLKFIKLIYSIQNKYLDFTSASKTSNGKYVAILYDDWEKRLNRQDIKGEYHTIQSFLIIVNSSGKKIATYSDVIFYYWLNDSILFLGKGVATEGCPDFHVDNMEIVDISVLKIIEVLDNNLFSGRTPKLLDDKIEFPSCYGEPSKFYAFRY